MDALARPLQVVRRLDVIHQRQIQYIQPDYRPSAIVAMLMPQASGGQDEVTTLHRAFFAIDQRPGPLALHHHAHGIGGMAVRRCQFTRQQQLHAQVHRRAGLHFFQPVAGVGQHQHAALGFLDRGEFARLEQQRAQGLV